MKKAELKAKYLEWNKAITDLSEDMDLIMEKSKQLNYRWGDGKRYCSLAKNVEEVIKANVSPSCVGQAIQLMTEYCRIEGQQKALRDLAYATDNFKI